MRPRSLCTETCRTASGNDCSGVSDRAPTADAPVPAPALPVNASPRHAPAAPMTNIRNVRDARRPATTTLTTARNAALALAAANTVAGSYRTLDINGNLTLRIRWRAATHGRFARRRLAADAFINVVPPMDQRTSGLETHASRADGGAPMHHQSHIAAVFGELAAASLGRPSATRGRGAAPGRIIVAIPDNWLERLRVVH